MRAASTPGSWVLSLATTPLWPSSRFRRGLSWKSMSRGFRNADETQALSEQATAGAIGRILDEDADQAARAAERQARGAFGVCEDCDGDIGKERLEALPSTTRCVSCQASWESTNRR